MLALPPHVSAARPLNPPRYRGLATPILLAVCVAALGACADSPPPTAPSSAMADRRTEDLRSDASDDAKLNWRAPGTPGTLRDAVLTWNSVIDAFFQAPVFVPGQPPPRDARDYAMASVAIHDVLNAIDRRYAPYAYTATATRRVSGDAAIAAAVRDVLVAIGATLSKSAPNAFANERYQAALAEIPEGPEKADGIALGQAVAAAVLAARFNDGSVGPPALPYTSAQTPGSFRPLVPNASAVAVTGAAALPYWENVRPFVMQYSSQFRSAAPYGTTNLAAAVQSPAYLADYAEVKALGGLVSQRTPEQTQIGRFWIESSSQGWNRVARAILDTRQQTAWRTARLLGQMHLAIADSYISVFESKYYYDFWRPVTAIRLGNMDPGTPSDPTWNVSSLPDLGATPPVPEWPSAHAMAGAAAAEVIKENVPGTTAFTMEATTDAGRPRGFRSVDEAVQENNSSRVYVGFHFRSATHEGERVGRLLGRYVAEHGLLPVRGR